jgi:putative SOS response-associated peptidase YedK
MPVVTNDRPDEIQRFQWGLVPFWSKEGKQSYNTANAMVETVMEKPTWREPIRKRRCLVPTTGFFEWRHLGKEKYPYRIFQPGNSIFSFAGIWDTWVSKDTGEMIKSYSILTMPANSFMEQIHNTKKRMPVIVDRSLEQYWLDVNNPVKEVLTQVTGSVSQSLTAHTVRKDFFRLGGFVDEITESVVYPELELYD